VTSAVLAGLLLREPFQPFHFVLGDHTDIHVDRPSQVRHETGNRIAVVTGSVGREYIIDLDHVVMIEVSPPKPRRGN
jgi:hypothetical protein